VGRITIEDLLLGDLAQTAVKLHASYKLNKYSIAHDRQNNSGYFCGISS